MFSRLGHQKHAGALRGEHTAGCTLGLCASTACPLFFTPALGARALPPPSCTLCSPAPYSSRVLGTQTWPEDTRQHRTESKWGNECYVRKQSKNLC